MVGGRDWRGLRGRAELGARGRLVPALALGAVLAGLSGAACAPSVVWFGKSPDRRHQASIIERAGEQRLRVDGRDGPIYDGIAVEALEWSPDGRRLAYAAQRGERWLVVRDGVEGPEYDGIGEVAWSAGGDHLAYAAQRGRSWHVVFDGREGPAFDDLLAGSLRPSPTGGRVAYAAQRRDGVFVVDDDRLLGPFNGVGRLAWTSADTSPRALFVARRGERARLVVGGVELAEHDAILEVALSPRGGRFAYIAVSGPTSFVVDGDASHPAYDRVTELVFSPDGRHLAYIARRSEADERVVIDGAAGVRFDRIQPGSLVFSPNSERFAYVGLREGAAHAVLDGIEGPPFRRIEAPVFGGRGERFGYVARRKGRSIVVLDGRESGAYAWAGNLAWSPDGKRVAYLAHRNKQPMVAHDHLRSAFDFVIDGSLVWSRDGASWACIVGVSSVKRLYIAVDGVPRVPVDLEEIMAALMKPPPHARSQAVRPAMLRAWVLAELERLSMQPKNP